MEKKTYNQLLSNILLFPLMDKDFSYNDPLYWYAKSYHELVTFNEQHGKTRERLKSNYAKNKKSLLSKFSKELRWDHLDEPWLMIEKFYPGLRFTTYFDRNSNLKNLNRFYIDHIFQIAKTFITFRNGEVALRYWSDPEELLLPNYPQFEKVELWNHIARTCVPDIFIAAAFVNFGITETSQMFNVSGLIRMADVPLQTLLKRGIAETHLHLNAGISYQYLWQRHTSLYQIDQESFAKSSADLWYCALFRFYSALYLEEEYCESFEEYYLKCIDNNLKTDFFDSYIQTLGKNCNEKLMPPSKREIQRIVKQVRYPGSKDVGDDFLLDTVYKSEKGLFTSSEHIWYCKLLNHILKRNPYDDTENLLQACFVHYLRCKNAFMQRKIQQTEIGGLDFFQSRYDQATYLPRIVNEPHDRNAYLAYKHIFAEQSRFGNLHLLEVKITPKVKSSTQSSLAIKESTLRQIQLILRAYHDYICETKELLLENDFRYPQIGLVYHFIKRNDTDNFSGFNCVIYDKSDKYSCLNYNAMREAYIRFVESLNELFQQFPLLTNYIVGIDAASIENATEPWVFAPVFQKVRSSNNVIPYSPIIRQRIQNIGFTYHVGEDFRHIISGLRHIDEVMTHFKYRTGDRLGHAIALGIDINRYIQNTPNTVIPIMEHLENLLWMWENAKSMELGGVDNLQFQIMDIAHKIYDKNMHGIDVYTLWRVYQAKFHNLTENILEKCKNDLSCNLQEKLKTKDFWTFEELLCTHYCPCFYETYNRPVFVRPSSDDAEFYIALQSHLVRKAERLGLYIETNPSSNLTIGDMESIAEHPLLRLNNRGLKLRELEETCVMSSINSDDPIVFSTFVENEISYIYYALLNAGRSREEAIEWIDKIRNQGLDSSFIRIRRKLQDILNDIEEILNYQLN